MIDETNDITNKEQVTIVIRSINEECLGLTLDKLSHLGMYN